MVVKEGKLFSASKKHRQEGSSLAYTLQMAVDSLSEYEGLNETAMFAARIRLHQASAYGPRKLRSEAARIRAAFYIYSEAVNYGRP